MFLAEPASTPYDFQFRLLGTRVRVVPWFWLVAALLGWNITQGPNQAMLLTLWIAAVFLSILVHELGHVLAMRYYGIDSYVVLYQFGGLAIPGQDSLRTGYGSRRIRDDPLSQIVISAAGPAAQLGLAFAVVAALWILGYQLGYRLPEEEDAFVRLRLPYVDSLLPSATARLIPSSEMAHGILHLLWVSIFWALLNLLPVYPLDGGQIARNVFSLFHPAAGIQYSLILSVVTGAAVAIYGFSQQQLFLAIMFALLAFSSFQVLQAYSGRGGYGP